MKSILIRSRFRSFRFLLNWIFLGLPMLYAKANEPSANLIAASLRVQSLDGQWQIAKDSYDTGTAAKWFDPSAFPIDVSRPVRVPGAITDAWPNPAPLLKASNLAWYFRTFTPAIRMGPGMRQYLRFGAVREQSEVWLNGVDLGSHNGGEDPFEMDVSKVLVPGRTNTLILRVSAPFFPGGINQHVEIVAQPYVRFIDGFAKPDLEKGAIFLDVTLENVGNATARVEINVALGEYKSGRQVRNESESAEVPPGRATTTIKLDLPNAHLWTLDDPFLYTIVVGIRWPGAPSEDTARDGGTIRMGFRDFRIKEGYFCLNGKRLLLKSTHGNWYDPITIQGTPSDMRYLNQDLPRLKEAGFNAMRFITASALPEQLDQADELGMLIYSEHDTSWPGLFLDDVANFGRSLAGVIRRDRNHPSLVMWGLLNENTSLATYNCAKAWLPKIRAIDGTRLIMLSSGRWDGDFKTASASNPGSGTWNVYLGGEDPVRPVSTGSIPDEVGGYGFFPGTGDAHIYNRYPTSWRFVTDFANLGRNTKPFFLSEGGIGSLYNSIREEHDMNQAKAPQSAYAWNWIRTDVAGLKKTWSKYGLGEVYPEIENMLIDSELSASRQRELIFSIVRSNPKVNGYSLTSMDDAWGAGEGVMSTFREFKAGHLPVLKAGWAPVRWCLFVNPMNAYADRPLHIKVALANEDRLPPGEYPVTLTIVGAGGTVWRRDTTLNLQGGFNAPLAYGLVDEDVSIPELSQGEYSLKAMLGKVRDVASDTVSFTVTDRMRFPDRLGDITVDGLGETAQNLLLSRGARLHNLSEGGDVDREVILLGATFCDDAERWRALYSRIARGAHAVFLSPSIFAPTANSGPKTWQHDEPNPVRWLALGGSTGLLGGRKGLVNSREALYHKEVIAKNGPAFDGLRPRLMTPEYYGDLLEDAAYFDAVPAPDETDAVAINCGFYFSSEAQYSDGVVMGTYKHHAGHFTICGFNILGHLGTPAADRLLINLVKAAASDANARSNLPEGYEAELESLGIRSDF